MADPRLGVSYDNLLDEVETYLIDDSTITFSAAQSGGSSAIGMAVSLSAADTVQLCSDAEEVIGKLIKVASDGIATVQIKGAMTLPGGTGATLTLGSKVVGDLLVAAKGYVRIVNTAVDAEVALGRGYILNASTTTAVWIMF